MPFAKQLQIVMAPPAAPPLHALCMYLCPGTTGFFPVAKEYKALVSSPADPTGSEV